MTAEPVSNQAATPSQPASNPRPTTRYARDTALDAAMQPLSEEERDPAVWASGEARVDSMNRLLCNARRRDGELCSSPAMSGMRVCRMHGGTWPAARKKARLRLAELVDPAIAVLAREMTDTTNKPGDRIRAAENILDRAGYPRTVSSSDGDLARALLIERLLAMKNDRAYDQALALTEAEASNRLDEWEG